MSYLFQRGENKKGRDSSMEEAKQNSKKFQMLSFRNKQFK